MTISRTLVAAMAALAMMLTSDWTAHDGQRAPEARGGGPGDGPGDVDRARRHAADAICDRAVRCGSIQPHDEDACRASTNASLARELTDDGCPTGVIPEAVVRCVEGLRAAPCQLVSPDPTARCHAATLCTL